MMLLTHDRTANELRERFPEWHIWQSDIGRLWARRLKGPSYAQLQAGGVATVDADSGDELAELIEGQEQIKEVAP